MIQPYTVYLKSPSGATSVLLRGKWVEIERGGSTATRSQLWRALRDRRRGAPISPDLVDVTRLGRADEDAVGQLAAGVTQLRGLVWVDRRHGQAGRGRPRDEALNSLSEQVGQVSRRS